ncbi:HNH endonuclease [Singulisphaera sp. Ch08]|uniref:HNH endonuclease n=1 Tax=Singulisphaera sp. Ch08 TaxID=3120278 RepID=A0AAU7CKW4_9BACT
MEKKSVRLKIRNGRRWETKEIEIPTEKEIRTLADKLHAARQAHREQVGDLVVKYTPSKPLEYTAQEVDPFERAVISSRNEHLTAPAMFEIRHGEWLNHVWQVTAAWVDGDDKPPFWSRDEKKLLPPVNAVPQSLFSEPADTDQVPVKFTQPLLEGDTYQIEANKYERNPEARRRCIEHYGPRCLACGFDFNATYGPVANGFIHIHHLVPISNIGEEYVVDPIADLNPLCPNCHAVAHLRRPPYSIEELKSILRTGARR